MRLIYLASSPGVSLYQSGGAGTHIRGTIKGFELHGINVLPVIAGDEFKQPLNFGDNSKSKLSPNRSLRNYVKGLMPKKVRLLIRELRSLLYSFKFEAIVLAKIKQFKPDAIYERSGYFSFTGNRIAKKLKIPLFLETDGCMVEVINDNYGVFSVRLGNYLEAKKLQKADYIVVYNRSSIEFIRKKFDIQQSAKILIKKLGIALDSYQISSSNINSLKMELGLENKTVIGFVGMISSYHGLDYLLKAASNLKNRKDIVFVIVGESKESFRLKRFIEEEKLNVILIGKVNKEVVGNYYALFDIGIIPDAVEYIYPVKVLEYGLFGKCPLVPSYICFKEILVNDFSGLFFNPKDYLNMADVISQASLKKDQIKRIGENWSNEVVKKFHWGESVKEVANSLKSLKALR